MLIAVLEEYTSQTNYIQKKIYQKNSDYLYLTKKFRMNSKYDEINNS